MKSPRITAPLEPRTSGCGAATDSGIKSTLNTNQKMPAMSPAAAAALKDLKVGVTCAVSFFDYPRLE
jgi:hypothetical protein